MVNLLPNEPFADVPQDFTRRVIDESQRYPEAKYAIAAYEAVVFYTGFELRESMFSSFELHVEQPRSGDHRLLQLGNSIFSLRGQPLLPELARRLHERPLRSVFFELSVAAFCRNMGFALQPAPGIPKKGFDFDFTMRIDQANGPVFIIDSALSRSQINVEVTELQAESASAPRLTSRLKIKSKQLAQDYPAMLFCFYPFQWTSLDGGWEAVMDEAVDAFFAGSHRVNWVVFIREWVGPAPTKEASFVQHFTARRNPNARHQAADLDNAMRNQFIHCEPGTGAMLFRPGLKEWVDSVVRL